MTRDTDPQNFFSYLGLRSNLSQKRVTIDDLYLDANNPRLFGEVLFGNDSWDCTGLHWSDKKVQARLGMTLERFHGLQPLIDSLAALGYVPVDQIVVYEAEPSKFVILEGNRRVSAMKRIIYDNWRHARNDPADVLDTFRSLDVLVLQGNQDTLVKDTFLLQGVRHVAGIRSWGPYQQARMVYACVVEKGLTYKETGASIGLSAARASSMLHAYLGIKQMEEHPKFGVKARPDLYSHFDQAYKQQPVRDWLGWDKNTRRYAHTAQVERFYALILGDEEAGQRPMAAVEVRDVLPGILENDVARHRLFVGELSVAQASSLVPQQHPDPSQVMRGQAKAFLAALDDLPTAHLLSRAGRLDMKTLHDVHERLDALIRAYARDKIHKAIA